MGGIVYRRCSDRLRRKTLVAGLQKAAAFGVHWFYVKFTLAENCSRDWSKVISWNCLFLQDKKISLRKNQLNILYSAPNNATEDSNNYPLQSTVLMPAMKITITQFCVRSNLMVKRRRLEGSGIGLHEEVPQQFSGWNEGQQRKSQPAKQAFRAGFYHGTSRTQNWNRNFLKQKSGRSSLW